MSHDPTMTRADSTTQANACNADSRVARCAFVNKSDLGKGDKTDPPLHPCGYLVRHAPFPNFVRLLATPQSYLEV